MPHLVLNSHTLCICISNKSTHRCVWKHTKKTSKGFFTCMSLDRQLERAARFEKKNKVRFSCMLYRSGSGYIKNSMLGLNGSTFLLNPGSLSTSKIFRGFLKFRLWSCDPRWIGNPISACNRQDWRSVMPLPWETAMLRAQRGPGQPAP